MLWGRGREVELGKESLTSSPSPEAAGGNLQVKILGLGNHISGPFSVILDWGAPIDTQGRIGSAGDAIQILLGRLIRGVEG
jgi:hypothetical protein